MTKSMTGAVFGRSFARCFAWLIGCFAALAASLQIAVADPNQGPGGPILVVTNGTSNFGRYYAEILRTEGFNSFAVADVGSVTATTLNSYDVVVLAKTALTSTQATMFTNWVNAGGNLIAMDPSSQLATLLGISPTGTTLANAYLAIDGASRPGNGIVQQTLQFHGTAQLSTLSGASALATLYSTATTPTSYPAVTLRSVGASGGQAAAFTFDLATSIVYTRQGNPAWANQERDGVTPIRSDDKFYGPAASDPQPNWLDFSKVSIPQADEQQRFLANLIREMTLDRKPLPRFWYFPRGESAVVVMTGDDHGYAGPVGGIGTASWVNDLIAASPSGCNVNNWECIRGTAYLFTAGPFSNSQLASYQSSGFEIGLHVDPNCSNFTQSSLTTFYDQQIAAFFSAYPAVSPLRTMRHHCVVWSDWASAAKVEFNHGVRLDTTYYYWTPNGVDDTPGHFSGSAMPMRYADLDGTLIDVFQAVTQMTDESGQSYPFTPNTLLDRATGTEEQYGAYTVNAHPDNTSPVVWQTVVASAKARGVPVVSASQMLTWLDGRNDSSFQSLSWNNNVLTFQVVQGSGANGLQAMLPRYSANGVLSTVRRGSVDLQFEVRTIKGTEYAFFSATGGSYTATYTVNTTSPAVSGRSPASGATGVSLQTAVTATFNKALDPSTVNSNTVELRAGTALVSTTISYDASSRVVTIAPNSQLAGSTVYTVTLKGGTTDPRIKDLAGNPMTANVTWSFTTVAAAACPCSGWDSTTTPAVNGTDPNPVELGVKFRPNVNGYITGVRFYKAAGNTGTHNGHLWTAAGQLLASVTFVNETASGWQQALFSNPVAVTANTVYVAGYHAPNGRYSADTNYFQNSGRTNGPLYFLQNGESGGNGVYAYGSSGVFPTDSFSSSNYWVDVLFTTTAPADTTPPTVTTRSPAAGLTDVATNTTVTATFNEALDPASVSATSFVLRNSSNVVVNATVSYDAASRTATLTPSGALAASTTYTATLEGGSTDPRIKDAAGNALAADVTWSFTTAAPSNCPCTGWTNSTVPALNTNDPGAVELGVKFRPNINGFITGVRFYKASGNTGTHIGSLWSSSGQRLAQATFANESASGWQQVSFSSPVAVVAGTTYVASYFAPNGRYSADANYFAAAGRTSGPLYFPRDGESGANGLYVYTATGAFPTQGFASANYWVDVVFSTTSSDTSAPTITARSPAANASSVAVNTAVTVTFNEALNPSTVSASTIELRTASNTVVASTVSYNASTFTATLTPNAALAASSTYTVTVHGGATSPRIQDVAGNALAADSVWSFVTAAATVCPCTAWDASATPAINGDDPAAVELGVKFRTDVAGFITGIRFYKGPGNGGTHIASLWNAAGQRIAQATFNNETATGWQQVNFASPIAVAANTVYVASYFAPQGHYSGDLNYFSANGVDRGPLHLLRDGVSGGNGVYVYSSTSAFPNVSAQGLNYWVDVVFTN